MPMTFPSHQGFIAPLWRRWPDQFDMAALCVGAAMPDVIDGAISLFRMHLGQNIGHSLLGMAVLGVPLGFILRRLMLKTTLCMPPIKINGFLAYTWNLGVAALAREQKQTENKTQIIAISLLIGFFSHLLIDLVSHGHFPWLIPWTPKLKIFPGWWYDTWFRIWSPIHPTGKKVGPHAVIWALLSIAGIWMLVRPAIHSWKNRTRNISC